jgi:ABC-type multidrug transport system fused ATPase/permease subunit
MSYVQRFTSVFHDIAWQYNQIVTQHTDVQTAKSIFEAYDKQHLPESAGLLPQHWQKIQISQLNYIHELEGAPAEGQYRPGLHNLNIQIERGKRVALIGESGSGKSTLLALMRGLYPPKPGLQLIADGKNYDRLEVLSDYITLFPQEPEIFENTIEYNITLGLPFSREEVMKVCETAHFSEVVEQLPSGLESNIREKGVNLSGGQKQRLALARGVLAAKDSDIILLDEPTSSVDPKTELLIYERMFQDFSDKAIVSALHRLHLLVHFDYVYVMENGYIVDEGTFEYLREHSKVFQEMWRHQEQAGIA